MYKFFKDKSGSSTLMITIVICALLPIFLFFLFEVNHYFIMKYKFQGFADHLALASSLQVDEVLLQNGEIFIDPNEAENYANKLLVYNYGLNEDMSIKENSYVSETPLLKVYTVNTVDLIAGTEFTTDEGYTFKLFNPAVIIYTESKPRGLLFSNALILKSLSVEEATLSKNIKPVAIESNPMTINNMDFSISNVENSLRYTVLNPFVPVQWEFTSIPFSAGEKAVLDLAISDTIKVDSVIETIKIVGKNKNGTPYHYQTDLNEIDKNKVKINYLIPSNAPLGAKIAVNIKVTGKEKNKGNQKNKSEWYFPEKNVFLDLGFIDNQFEYLSLPKKSY